MQKNSYIPIFAVLAIMGFAAFSGSVSAQSLIDLNLGATSSSDTSVETDQNTNTSASSSTDVNVGAGVSDNEADSNEASPRDNSAMLSASVLLEGEVLNISRSSISADADARANTGEESETRATVSNASDVSSNADLEAYAKTMIESDQDIKEVNFTRNMVEVKYEEEGKFLALVPFTFTASAKAYADGRVEVDYPWYSFLTVDSHEEVETRAKVAVDNAIRAHAVGSVRAEGEVTDPRFTAAESATVASELHAVLSAKGEAETVD